MSPKSRWFLSFMLWFLAFDQGTKVLTRILLRERVDEFVIIPGWLGFSHAENRGAAFSALADSPNRMVIFLTFTAVAVVAIAAGAWMLNPRDRWPAAALGVLLSGALGNGIDRALFGQVTDMIKVSVGSGPLKEWCLEHYRTNVWPIFNVADSAIWIGIIGFPLAYLFVRDAAGGETNVAVDGSAPSLE
ncbi:MAG: signal peptidase II [Myxococcales bacterium]|nr:signal peptidase II [Myxococcales bacterium]